MQRVLDPPTAAEVLGQSLHRRQKVLMKNTTSCESLPHTSRSRETMPCQRTGKFIRPGRLGVRCLRKCLWPDYSLLRAVDGSTSAEAVHSEGPTRHAEPGNPRPVSPHDRHRAAQTLAQDDGGKYPRIFRRFARNYRAAIRTA